MSKKQKQIDQMEVLFWMDDRWVYDIVKDKAGLVIALCYHLNNNKHPDCLRNYEEQLTNEGFILLVSPSYPTLKDARNAAWRHKDQFTKDLD